MIRTLTAAVLAALLTACATGSNEVSLAQLAKENQANIGQLAEGHFVGAGGAGGEEDGEDGGGQGTDHGALEKGRAG